MGKKLFTFALCLFISVGAALAQTHKVSGTVKEAGTGSPIPGATVMVEGTLTGTSTDLDGKYTITAPSKGKITVSVIGFTTVTVSIDGRSTIDFSLEEDRNVLDDAVVVGYGSAKKVGSLVGSVSTVKSEVLKNAPSSSALDALQGQVAGLAVMTTGGVAGDNNVDMTLHGVGSLGASSAPLFIVDGIQASSRTIMAMNPNDIKSISILKDASATSIYGSRAANGVVYVTTKSGSYDSKASVTVRSQVGISTLADKTLYKSMMNSKELKEFWVRTGIHTPESIKATYTDKGYDADTKWYNYFQQFNNPQTQNDVTVEGGGNKVAYMIGASQFHQRGTSIGNYYDRYTFRSNVQGRPKDWLKIGANVNLSLDSRQFNGNWGRARDVSNYTTGGLSFLLNPIFPAIDPETGEEYEVKYPFGGTNPHYYMSKNPSTSDRYGIIGNVNIEIEPFKNFKINTRAGVDGYFSLSDAKTYPSYANSAGNGTRGKGTAMEYTASITNTLEYSFEITEDHKFTVLAGQEGIANYYDFYSIVSTGQTDDRLMGVLKGTLKKDSMEEEHTESKFLSFFAHADYTLFDKYIFDGAIRNDACSRFGTNNRDALFWSAGALWKVKKESFMKDVSWVDDLNFKVSYGTQGNAEIGDYQHLALIGTTADYAGSSSTVIGQPSNPALTWEKQALLTASLSGRVINMIDFTLEFYNRKTSSMLLDVPYNYTTGFKELTANVGGLRNTGIDITLGIDILRSRDYFLRFNTTFNWNDERVTELFNGLDRWEMTSYGLAYVVGKPVSFYAPIYAGVDPEDGKMMWYLPGENVDETTKDKTTKVFDEAALTQNTGKSLNAPANGGFGFSGAWKGLSFMVDFSYVLGKTLINNDGIYYANPNQFSNQNAIREVNDYWTPENRNAKYPDWTTGVTMNFDTHLYQNADFMRLKNLQVGYSLPKKWMERTNFLNAVKVSFTGRNLLTFTKYPGVDPEVNSNLTRGRAGNSKQYLFGLEITF